MHKRIVTAGAVFGGLAVALGAFGAHGLERITGDPTILHGYRTGVEYQFYHALALLLVAVLSSQEGSRWINWSATCFIVGIILFSGSLYLLTFLKIQGSNAIRFIGPITPLGGIMFIAGWLCLLVAATKKKLA